MKRILLAVATLTLFARNRARRLPHPNVTRADPSHSSDPPSTPADEGGDRGLYDRIPAATRWEQDKSSAAQRFGRWLLGRERNPVPSYIGLIEEPPPEGAAAKTGICCSGGGIRSAAFNLGALQELQAADRLQTAKYITAVSGGAYIAAAFSMVAKTSKPGD